MSLAPPPRDELTIRLPGGATRVSAAGTTTGSVAVVNEHAEVDVPRVQGAVLQPGGKGRMGREGDGLLRDPSARLLRDEGPRARELLVVRPRPDDHPQAAVSVDGFNDEPFEPIEHEALLIRVGAVIRRYLLEGAAARGGSIR